VAGDVPGYLPDLVEAVGKANHDYFVRRGQNRVPWDELPPIYRDTAKESHFEILQDGPVEVIREALERAWAEGVEHGENYIRVDPGDNPYEKGVTP
jgi:hypothetical protein